MRESIYFKFDDINSKDFGVFMGSTDNGLFQESFLPSRTIVEKKIAGRERPYLQRVDNDSLSFSLSIVLEDWEDKDNLRDIARWLFQDSYQPLVFDSNPNRVFYAIVEGDSTLFHNGARDGYVELNIRCNSPYTYSKEYTVNNINYKDEENELKIYDDHNSFNEGTHINTVSTSNGLTAESTIDTWGDIIALHEEWGSLINGNNK